MESAPTIDRRTITALTDQQLDAVYNAWRHDPDGSLARARTALADAHEGIEALFTSQRAEIDYIIESIAARRIPGGIAYAVVAAATWYHLAHVHGADLTPENRTALTAPWSAITR